MQLERPREILFSRPGRSILSAGVVALIAWLLVWLHIGSDTTAALLFVLIILSEAIWWGMPEAVAGALAATPFLAYFFMPPVGSLKNQRHWTTGSIWLPFSMTAVLASDLSAPCAAPARYEAIARQRELEVSNHRLDEEPSVALKAYSLNILPIEVASELHLKKAP